ncbi:MAG: glycoside hydrolase family 28 protein [Bryobacteraceae bacterium]
MQTSRRKFLTSAASAALAGMARGAADSQAEAWSQVPQILARIKAPVFAKRDFEITRFGAVADGKKDCTDAIARAIAECNRAGGGRVLVPAGIYSTAAIHLKSNVELHLSSGATLRFARNPKLYLPVVFTRFEGTECMNYSPFVYADGQENIAITGQGTLDGNGDCDSWWAWAGKAGCRTGKPRQDDSRTRLTAMGDKDVPVEQRVFGDGWYLRPCFIQPVRSKNVLIEGVTIVNSPMYELNPLLCTNVTIRGVKTVSHGPNNDGCDPDSCKDVLIEDCLFDTGDDCIAIKSGRNRDGRRAGVASENLVIRNCTMKDGHGGITIGSEMSGGVRNVFAEACHLNSRNLNQALRFKTNAVRGGTIENVYFRNLDIGEISDSVLQIDFNYQEGANGSEHPNVRNIDIRDVTCRKAKYAWDIQGFANDPVRNVHFERCTFGNIASANVSKNVEALTLTDVKINGKEVVRR